MYTYITCIHTLHAYIHYNYTYIHVHQFPVMKHHALAVVIINHMMVDLHLCRIKVTRFKNIQF